VSTNTTQRAQAQSSFTPPGRIAVGTMNFGKRTDAAESQRIVARAIERGATFFDTANVYNDGESERILGAAVKARRDSVQIATKVGFGRVDGKQEGLAPERVHAAIDASLARLGTDHVDVYYLHVPDPATPIEATLDAIHAILRAGKARAWGISNYASWQILEMDHLADARGMPRPAIAQQMYNVLIRQLDVEYFAFTRRYPIHTTVYNPLAGGLLTGLHARDASTARGSRFDNNKLYQRRYWTDRMFDAVDALKAVASREGMSLLDLSYAWLAGRPGVDSILVGPASVDHLDAAIDGAAKSLGPEPRAAIDELHRAFQGTDATYMR
jgi:aryl-alcohol dehydrogenase-like predicted oxidoreductase